MSELKGAAIFAQSGGPTAVINASAAGVITEALKADAITHVYGSAHGVRGMLDDVIYDMSKEDARELELLTTTPSSALGSARYKLKNFEDDDTDYVKLLSLFRKYNIRYMFFNGGNDSMDTCSKVSRYLKSVDYECRVFGVPKTIDNDLWGTDHCPGYGSAAKYIVTSCMEIALDAKVYDTGMVIVIEIMGRNAGWLTAASALASYKGLGPDLIYLPELPFDVDKFLGEVDSTYKAHGNVIVAVSEGLRDANGVYVPEMNYTNLAQDSFGHTQLGGAASVLGNLVKQSMKVKVRPIEFSLLQRCAAHCASKTDVDEAFLAGQLAVKHALDGKSGYMVGFERAPGADYVMNTTLLDVNEVANKEKTVPRDWINEAGNGMKQQFIDYALPLIQGESRIATEGGLPRFAKLKKIRA
ncbi:MAG: 6-phosphofructokinase [Oscillospiraceae bacterium]|nr:6-phosphofructokinase [Oscillospiraceae bacterium]